MITCLKCGSENIDYYEKKSVAEIHKIYKDGTISKRPIDIMSSGDGSYCSCLDCDKIFGVNLIGAGKDRFKIESIYELDHAIIKAGQ